ncbi:60 kDa chaperonin 3 [Bienertia sinuspersici]
MGVLENVAWRYVSENGLRIEIHRREIKTFDVDTDDLCWFLIEELAIKCGGYTKHDQIYYMEPNAECFEKGLRRVYTDAEVRNMTEIVLKYRTLNLYVVPAANADMMTLFLSGGSSDFKSLTQMRKKLSPRRKESKKKRWREGTTISYHVLSDATSSEDDAYEPNNSDHITNVEVDHVVETEFEDHAAETESEDDIGKEEQFYSDGLEFAKQLQKKVVEGTVISEQKEVVDDEQEAERGQDGYVSEYAASGDELDTDFEIEDDELVGIRFPNREEFKECVTRYAVAQGRNLTWIVKDKNRQQRLGVKCNPGCPFRLYCSWDSRRAALVVKSVEDQHTCVRNM